jgi:DNA-directed RNA polymerase specialized sigma24 family protein
MTAHRHGAFRGGRAHARRAASRTHPAAAPQSGTTALSLADLWNLHGPYVYALACALLADEEAAAEVVILAVTDHMESSGRSAEDARRSLARHVYWRSQEVVVAGAPAEQLPPVMVELDQLAQLQRACLALCVFGGHTYREAAGLLGVPPATVAELLTAALREVTRSAGDGAALTA